MFQFLFIFVPLLPITSYFVWIRRRSLTVYILMVLGVMATGTISPIYIIEAFAIQNGNRTLFGTMGFLGAVFFLAVYPFLKYESNLLEPDSETETPQWLINCRFTLAINLPALAFLCLTVILQYVLGIHGYTGLSLGLALLSWFVALFLTAFKGTGTKRYFIAGLSYVVFILSIFTIVTSTLSLIL